PIHGSVVGAAMPGLGGLLGQRQYERAQLVRRELLALTWLFTTAVGATILLWNHSFVGLWVGAQHYAGPDVDLLIVLIAVQTAFIRADAYIIDAALQAWLRVVISAAATVVTITLAIALTRAFGLPGLCVGVLAGRTLQTLTYPALARRCVEDHGPVLPLGFARGLVVTAALFSAGSALGQRLEAERSEEHTSELQSRFDLVCRLLLEKKNTVFRMMTLLDVAGSLAVRFEEQRYFPEPGVLLGRAQRLQHLRRQIGMLLQRCNLYSLLT